MRIIKKILFFLANFLWVSLSGQTTYLCDSTLVKKIVATYQNCTSYYDESESIHYIGDWRTVNYSKIAYKRDNTFLLELLSIDNDNSERSKKFIIYKAGNNSPLFYQKWGTQPNKLDALSALSSLNLAIAQVVPLTYGTGSLIADLLFPDSISAANPLKDYGVLESLAEEVVNQDTCYKFKHTWNLQQDADFIEKLKNKNEHTLNEFAKKEIQDEAFYWFRKKDLLLVKVEFYRTSNGRSSDYTWVIKPQINIPVPESDLQPSIILKSRK